MGKSDVFEVFKYIQILLNMTGLWPKPDATSFYKIKGFVSYFLSAIFNVLALTQIYLTFSGIESVSYSLFLNLAIIFYLPKIGTFLYNRQQFYKILENLNQPVLKSYEDDLDFYIEKKKRTFTILQLSFQTLCGVVLFLVGLVPFFGDDFEEELPIPFPFTLRNQPRIVYGFVWVLQLYILNLSALNNTSVDILACSFMGIASAHLEILREKLKRVATVSSTKTTHADEYFATFGKNDEEVLRKIKNCVQHHTAIEELIKSVESTFTFMFLVQLLSSVSLICITEFTLILVPLASVQFGVSSLFFGCAVTQLAIYCVFGNDVTVQSSKIGEACYLSEWNNCKPNIRKMLLVIMERSKRPYFLTAGKFAKLTLDSFVLVLKSSFSYFTVLQKLYNKTRAAY